MANLKKLFWKNRNTIQEKINRLGGDEALSKQATKFVLSRYESKIQQKGLSINFLQKKLINDQIIDEKFLSRVLNSTIYQDCLNQKRNISYAELQELIDNQYIVGKGISAATCKRFRLGENIDGKAFDILCKTLQVNAEDVCDKKQPVREILKKEEELNIELCKFNYRSQKKSFRERKDTYHSLYLRKLPDKNYSCHWLLKSLIINKS
ncbi:hypothetical protein [Gloeothece verrucosa]|uniref:Uncharacterized protein n=1 Tax=Gloeothece verrucosa (strain PCC 7822) TaxID=497965 RepID=E0UFE2_GLOV7|nr:hypothetical protein [Gloeothece verrucosa]ADN16636.1 hypothetical protein Cyan7822_4732 [Gloeothece verrucosa PCC 7822]